MSEASGSEEHDSFGAHHTAPGGGDGAADDWLDRDDSDEESQDIQQAARTGNVQASRSWLSDSDEEGSEEDDQTSKVTNDKPKQPQSWKNWLDDDNDEDEAEEEDDEPLAAAEPNNTTDLRLQQQAWLDDDSDMDDGDEPENAYETPQVASSARTSMPDTDHQPQRDSEGDNLQDWLNDSDDNDDDDGSPQLAKHQVGLLTSAPGVEQDEDSDSESDDDDKGTELPNTLASPDIAGSLPNKGHAAATSELKDWLDCDSDDDSESGHAMNAQPDIADTSEVHVTLPPQQKLSFHDDWLNRESEDEVPAEVTLPSGLVARKLLKGPGADATSGGNSPHPGDDSDGSDVEDWLGDMNPTSGHDATHDNQNDWHEEDPSENMTHTMRVARKKLEDTHGEHAPFFLDNIQLYTSLLRISDLRFDELDPLTQRSLMESLEVRHFSPDEVIVHEGDESSEFYLLLGPPAAEVLIRKSVDGAEQNITRLHRGQYFGQRHFTTRKQQKRNATAAAITDVELGYVRSDQFHLWTHFRTYLLMKEVPMLRTLPDQEQRAMQKNLQMQEFVDGDYIVRQGEYGDKFYIITEGSAMVLETITHADGTLQDVVLTQLYEGHFFGEMALIYEEPRVASVCAVGRTTCMYLTKEAFRSALTAQQFQIMMQEISYKRVTTREQRLRTRTTSEQPAGLRTGSPSISQPKAARRALEHDAHSSDDEDNHAERAQLAVQMTNILVRTRLNTGDRLINKYLIMDELGRGSYGGVYLCRNEESGQLYAMKMLTRSARHGKQLTETIRQEIAVMKKLRHRNIVTLHEVIDDPAANQVFLVQEYMEGGTVMNDAFGDPISPSKARVYFRDMLQGVVYLHSVGVVHRDIKPQNMLLSADDVLKLADFGTAVFKSDASEYMKAGGTPAYMAPELFAEKQSDTASRVASPKVDIWSLGATLFNLVVGRPPWVASNQILLAHQIQHVELVFPPEAEDLDPHLKNLLRRMLHKDPDRRISMEDIINHEWVTDEGADPLMDIKAQRPAHAKHEQMQVTEFEVQQAVVMPPSVMSLLKRKLAAARNKFSRAFHDKNRGSQSEKPQLRGRSERERDSIGDSEPPTPYAESIGTPPAPKTRAQARAKMEAMRPRQIDNPHRRGSWNFFGSSADNSPVGSEHQQASTPSKASNSPTPPTHEQASFKPHRNVPPLAIRAPVTNAKRRASLQATNSIDGDLPSPLFIEKRDSESSGPVSARTARGSGSGSMRKSIHTTRSMQSMRSGRHRRVQTNDGNMPRLSAAELEVLQDQKFLGGYALSAKEVLNLHSPAIFPSPPTTPRSRMSHCTADSDGSRRDSNCSYHSALVMPDELVRRHSTMSMRSDLSRASAAPMFFDAQSSPNEVGAPAQSPATGKKPLQRTQDFIMVPTHMAKDVSTGVQVRRAVVLMNKGVATAQRPASSTGPKPKAHIPELDSDSDNSDEFEVDVGANEMGFDRHGSSASAMAAQALDTVDSSDDQSSDSSEGLDDADELEDNDIEVVGDTEMNLMFEELCTDDAEELDDPDLQPVALTDEKLQKLFELRTWANQVNMQLGLRYGVAQAKGPRPYMEDRNTVISSLLASTTGTSPHKSPRSRSPTAGQNRHAFGPDFAFAAIYDGHNGDEVAEHLKDHFHTVMYRRLCKLCCDDSAPVEAANLDPVLIGAIEAACLEMDELILAKEHDRQQDLWLQAEDDDDPRALVSRVQSSAGATCAFAVVLPEGYQHPSTPRRLAVANIGDCRVVLSVGGNATNLTSDHKPMRADEKQRIEKAGGWVHKGRLGGILAVSRAFGDSAYKTYPTDELWGEHQQLVARPGVQVLEISDDFEFVIVASDGLWDVLPSELAVNFVRRRLSYHGDVQRAANELVTKAGDLGTADNVSAVICSLNQVKLKTRAFGASKTTVFGSSKQDLVLSEQERQRQTSTASNSSDQMSIQPPEVTQRQDNKPPVKARRASLTALGSMFKGQKSDDGIAGDSGEDFDANLMGRHSTSTTPTPKQKKGVRGLFGKS